MAKQQQFQQQSTTQQYQQEQLQQLEENQSDSNQIKSAQNIASPTYVNTCDLANMKRQQQQQQQNSISSQLQQQHSVDSMSSSISIHSNDSSSGGGTLANAQSAHMSSTTAIPAAAMALSSLSLHQSPQQQQQQYLYQQQQLSSMSPFMKSTPTSLHSHPSFESTAASSAGSLPGQTPTQTPSSGSSTPQNQYSPLLTNSPSSTAAGTPSGASGAGSCSVGSGIGFVGAQSMSGGTATPSPAHQRNSDVLQITEIESQMYHDQQQQQQQHYLGGNSYNSNNIVEQHKQQQQYQQQLENAKVNQNVNQKIRKNFDQQKKALFEQQSMTAIANEDTNLGYGTTEPSSLSIINIIENDERSRASVLQKASMFEKQAKASVKSTPAGRVVLNVNNAVAPEVGGVYGSNRGLIQQQQQHHQQVMTGNQSQGQDQGCNTNSNSQQDVGKWPVYTAFTVFSQYIMNFPYFWLFFLCSTIWCPTSLSISSHSHSLSPSFFLSGKFFLRGRGGFLRISEIDAHKNSSF